MHTQKRAMEWEEQELKELIQKYDAITIPVQTKIEAEQHVLDMSTAKEILLTADIIALGNCYCRENLKNCDNPIDVCLSINNAAQEEIKSKRAVPVSLDKAMAALEQSHKAGLVHLAYSKKGEKIQDIICSCCSCCCHHLYALQQFGYCDALIKSDVRVQVDKSLCIDCGICIERCNFGAWSWDTRAVLDETACFGCGVCVSTCPQDALSLVPR